MPDLWKAALYSAPWPCCAVAADGRILEANQHYANLIGYPLNEIVHMRYQDFTHPDDLGTDRHLHKMLLSGDKSGGYRMHKRYIKADGSIVWVDLHVGLSPDSSICIAWAMDITAQKAAESTIKLEQDLRAAVRMGQLFLQYQPIVELATGRIITYEALVRWRVSPDEVRFPDVFLPIARAGGFIYEICYWVINEVLEQVACWQRAGKSWNGAINLEPITMARDDFQGTLHHLRTQHQVPVEKIWLEVLEEDAASSEVIRLAVERLGKQGYHVSIDDFGVKFSTYARLPGWEIKAIKIDRSLIANCGTDPATGAIVESIIGMARKLKLQVIAEGVETQQQAQWLKAQGCRYGQGYLFGKPQAAPI